MTVAPPRRKGSCPGALRPMETGDGLLVRVRASGGRLTLDQAMAIAEAAAACGNCAISLSARGNLQIRGATERTLPDLQARLAAAGLLDADPEVERLRNIVVSALSDIDPEAAFDLAPALAGLEARLALDETLRALPAKFSFALDAGGRFSIADVEADIRFEAIPPRPLAGEGLGVRAKRARGFRVLLAGDDRVVAFYAPEEVGEIAARLARAFLALTATAPPLPALPGDGPRRMRTLVERLGLEAVRAAAFPSPAKAVEGRPSFDGLCGRRWPREARSDEGVRYNLVPSTPTPPPQAGEGGALGLLPFGAATVVGLAAPFGALDARQLAALVERARDARAESLRLAPQRVLFVAGVARDRAAAFAQASADLGFILDSADLRLRAVACPGAPACLHANGPVREDAEAWAKLLPQGKGVVLHVSGCAKGCARPAPTAATLVATPQGYDLVARGRASDPPSRRGLSRSAVAALIASGEAFNARLAV